MNQQLDIFLLVLAMENVISVLMKYRLLFEMMAISPFHRCCDECTMQLSH